MSDINNFKSIDRKQMPVEQLNVEDFIDLAYDYSGLGTIGEQDAILRKDFETVNWRAINRHDGSYIKVEDAFYRYLELIRGAYSVLV